MKRSLFFLVVAGFITGTLGAQAQTLRWSSQGDFQTMDPHAINETLNNNGEDFIYEPLVEWGKKVTVEPCLALSWEAIDPRTTRFKRM